MLGLEAPPPICYTREAEMLLERVFELDAHPCSTSREQLAEHLNITPKEVQTWFQNKQREAGGNNKRREVGGNHTPICYLREAKRDLLERAFELDSSPCRVAREQLAAQINITPRQVQVWFQNKRRRARKNVIPHWRPTPEDERMLLRVFELDPNPGEDTIGDLSGLFSATSQQVREWFRCSSVIFDTACTESLAQQQNATDEELVRQTNALVDGGIKQAPYSISLRSQLGQKRSSEIDAGMAAYLAACAGTPVAAAVPAAAASTEAPAAPDCSLPAVAWTVDKAAAAAAEAAWRSRAGATGSADAKRGSRAAAEAWSSRGGAPRYLPHDLTSLLLGRTAHHTRVGLRPAASRTNPWGRLNWLTNNVVSLRSSD